MIKLTLILLAAVVLGGCQKQNSPTDNNEKKDAFTSIRDAVTKQLVLKCEYKDEDGEMMTTYIKGQSVRFIGKGEQANLNGILKDNSYYLWNTDNKEGMVFPLDKMTEDGSVSMKGKTIKGIEDVIAVLEEDKGSCQLSPESANLLEVPAEVKFSSGEGFLK